MQFRNFISAAREPSNTGSKFGTAYYKPGVRVKFPKSSKVLRMQILPAYNPANPSDPQGCVQCLAGGQPTAWFSMIQAAKFVGHQENGDWKATRPILSLSSFEGREPCPYDRLLRYCKNNPDWKYLVSRVGEYGKPGYREPILKPIKPIMLVNIVDVDNPGDGVQIFECTYGMALGMLDSDTGIVFQRNLQLDNFPNVEEAIAANPMIQYANGDITDPNRAPVFIVDYSSGKAGKFGSGYNVRIEISGSQVSRRRATPVELASRYHLEDMESYLDIKDGQAIVDSITEVLRGHVNDKGIDEVCALREAVGDTYRVDTATAPGAVNTVQGYTLPKNPPPAAAPVPIAPPPPDPVKIAAVPAGFGANPAVAPAVAVPVNPAAPATPVNPAVAAAAASVGAAFNAAPAQTATMAIPGELPPGENIDLANALAARLRSAVRR